MRARFALWLVGGCLAVGALACGGDDSSPGTTAGSAGTGGTGGAGTGGSGGSGGSGDTDASGASCGGIASIRCGDPDLSFCDFPDKTMCGAADMAGVCVTRPTACAEDCPGVCGCDGKFYCNACQAHRAGTDDIPLGTCGDAAPLTLNAR